MKLCGPLRSVCLFSHKNEEFVYLICLIKKQLSLLIKMKTIYFTFNLKDEKVELMCSIVPGIN